MALKTSPAGEVVCGKSALLHQSGQIVGDDGVTPGLELPAAPGDYYLLVQHRNHTSAISATAISLQAGSSAAYDFTTGSDKFFSSKNAVEVESGKWAVQAVQDGHLTSRDYVAWYKSDLAGDTGYQTADFDMNGIINQADYLLWRANAVK